jgi:hypothetical protein
MKTPSKATSKYRAKLEQIYKRRKIKNPQRHITRLFKSVYPAQYNDYIMLRYPKGYDAPVDAEIYPIVRKLLQSGFHVAGWDFNQYKTNRGFIMVILDPKNKTQNTQPRLAKNLATFFKAVHPTIHKTEPKQLDDSSMELVYFSNNAISINFTKHVLHTMMNALHVKPSTAQILPGAKASKASNTLLTKVWQECTNEIEPENMF